MDLFSGFMLNFGGVSKFWFELFFVACQISDWNFLDPDFFEKHTAEWELVDLFLLTVGSFMYFLGKLFGVIWFQEVSSMGGRLPKWLRLTQYFQVISDSNYALLSLLSWLQQKIDHDTFCVGTIFSTTASIICRPSYTGDGCDFLLARWCQLDIVKTKVFLFLDWKLKKDFLEKRHLPYIIGARAHFQVNQLYFKM